MKRYNPKKLDQKTIQQLYPRYLHFVTSVNRVGARGNKQNSWVVKYLYTYMIGSMINETLFCGSPQFYFKSQAITGSELFCSLCSDKSGMAGTMGKLMIHDCAVVADGYRITIPQPMPLVL